MTKDELKVIFNDVLDTRRGIDGEQHREDHEFIKILKEREMARQQRIERLKTQVIGFGMITAIGGVLSAVGYAVMQWVQHGGKP